MSSRDKRPDDRPSGGTYGRSPREERAAGAPFGTSGGAPGSLDPDASQRATRGAGLPVDPELEADLGAEFELRGDVLEAELEAARVDAEEQRDRALRAQAEFDNFRKRISREREDEKRRANERLVEELLPAIDNLERAIAHTTAGGDLKHLLTGVEAVHVQVVGILGKHGVSVIDPSGEPFDPMTQQAVSQQEDETVPEGTVTAVFQKGYLMGARCVRPAMVVVSTGGPKREE